MAQSYVIGVSVGANGVIYADIQVSDSAVNRKVPLTAVGNGKTKEEYEKEQQTINYLDTLKDGGNIQIVQGVSLYPKSMNDGEYPTPWKKVLHGLETEILNSQKQFLNRTTWTKVARGTPLDQPKEYNQIFWESGLGYTVFVANPGGVTTIKTFGSYIDPLEKQNAVVTWPPNGGRIELTQDFMELMGFGPSKVVATTLPGGKFEYQLTVACGNKCRQAPYCVFGHNGVGSDPNINLFKGNASKAQALASKNNGQDEKIKLLVVKEWGDKLQAIIYFLYTHIGKNATDTPTIITCDMVVMMFCVMLQVPCIYTGKESHYFPKPDDQDGKYYSIVEYKPSKTPEKDARRRYIYTRNQIIKENKRYIDGLQMLANNPETEVYLGGDMETFSGAFWKAMADDAQAIQTTLESEMPLLTALGSVANETVTQYNQWIDKMKMNYLLVPAVRSSATNKRNKIIAPTPAQFIKSRLTMSMGQYHTLAREQNHANLERVLVQISGVNAERQSKRPFYESARIITRSKMTGGGRRHVQRQRGGAPIPPEVQMREFPPFNDEKALYYTDLASNQATEKFDEEIPGYVDPTVSNTPAAQIEKGAVFEPSDPAPGEGLGVSFGPGEAPAIDLQAQFDLTLEDSVEQYVEAANKEHPGIINYGYNLHMTFESLLVYYAAYVNRAPVEITPDDLVHYQKEFVPDLFEPALPIGEADAFVEQPSPEPVVTRMPEGIGMEMRQEPYRAPATTAEAAAPTQAMEVERPPTPGVRLEPRVGMGREEVRGLSPPPEFPDTSRSRSPSKMLQTGRYTRRAREMTPRLSGPNSMTKKRQQNMLDQAEGAIEALFASGGKRRRTRRPKRSKSKTKRTIKKRRTQRKTRKQEKKKK